MVVRSHSPSLVSLQVALFGLMLCGCGAGDGPTQVRSSPGTSSLPGDDGAGSGLVPVPGEGDTDGLVSTMEAATLTMNEPGSMSDEAPAAGGSADDGLASGSANPNLDGSGDTGAGAAMDSGSGTPGGPGQGGAGTGGGDEPDGGGSLERGIYGFAAVPPPAGMLQDPPAVAWHPSGSHALILSATSRVLRYDADTGSLEVVHQAGTKVRWSDVTFAPDGSHAVLVGNDTSGGTGALYIRDDVSGQVTSQPVPALGGMELQAIAFSEQSEEAVLLASRTVNAGGWNVCLMDYSVAGGATGLRCQTAAAGCEDLAWASDSFGRSTVAIACGLGGVDLLHLEDGTAWVSHDENAGNTSRVASRPQQDYALAIASSSHKVYRFQTGSWSTDFDSPYLPGVNALAFSSDGRRALLVGGFDDGTSSGQVYEFRHDQMAESDFSDVSIGAFDRAPYNAGPGVVFNDVAWRPGCEEGLIVGGSATLGYLVEFRRDGAADCQPAPLAEAPGDDGGADTEEDPALAL